jgi:hypothetical protein
MQASGSFHALPAGEVRPWIGDWVSPRAGLGAVEKIKTNFPCNELRSVIQFVAILTELSRITK